VADTPQVSGSTVEAERWLSKARDDLAVAEVVLLHQIGASWAACFHAQQAAEKALNAVLVAAGIDFPRSHALERLHALLPADASARFSVHTLSTLSPWAVVGRYPEDIPNPSQEDSRQLVNDAMACVQTAQDWVSGLSQSAS
jgi:HEPN domain-containing protein